MSPISCSICIENLITAPLKSEDEIESNKKCKLDVSTAPCGHVFHTACLSQWVHHHHHCPQCRHPTSVTSMIKLYLSEEQEVKPPRGGLSSKLVEGAASLEQTTQGEYHTEAEDHKVIQDVLQCQLEDLESHLQRARKSLNLMEDQLQERVIELSALEIKLIRGQDREESLHQTIHQRDARIRELENSFFMLHYRPNWKTPIDLRATLFMNLWIEIKLSPKEVAGLIVAGVSSAQ